MTGRAAAVVTSPSRASEKEASTDGPVHHNPAAVTSSVRSDERMRTDLKHTYVVSRTYLDPHYKTKIYVFDISDIFLMFQGLMQELERERDRRWKSERSSRLLLEKLRQMQLKGVWCSS